MGPGVERLTNSSHATVTRVPATASFGAEETIAVMDVLATTEIIRGPDCAEDGSAGCRVGALDWVLYAR